MKKSQQNYIEETLELISKQGYNISSNEFFKKTAKFLANLFEVEYVFINKYSINKPTITNTIVVCNKKEILPNFSYELVNTPCEKVINKDICAYPNNIQSLFPKDELLVQMNIESYVGAPLWSSTGEPIGLIALLDSKPITETESIKVILQIVAIKAEKILEKLLYKDILRLQINKFKNLANLTFEGILIHNKGVVIDVNQAFENMFGYTKEELVGKNIKNIIFLKKHLTVIEKKLVKNYVLPYEIKGIKKDGTIFSVEIEAKNIDNKNETRVSAFRDLTEKKESQEENNKLLTAVEQSANTIIITDIEGNIEYANPKFSKMSGYTVEEVLGKNPRILNSKNLPQKYYTEMWKTINKGKTWNGEFQNKSKCGTIFWEQVTITPIKNDEGKIINFLAVKEDITQRKKAKEKLIEATQKINNSEKKFRELYEKSGDAILIIENGIFIDCNQATVEMLQYKTKKEFLNTHPSKLSPKFQLNEKSSIEEADRMIEKALKNGTHRFEWIHIKKNGENFPVEVLLTTITNNPNNKVIHCVWRDISNLKKSYKILESQNEELVFLSDQLSVKNNLLLESSSRFKNLFEQSPVSIWEQDFSEVIELINSKKEKGFNLETYFNKHPEFIHECISKIKIEKVNKKTLELLRVGSLEELIIHIRKTNSKIAIEVLKKEITSIALGKKEFKCQTEFIRTDGKVLTVIVKSSVINTRGKIIASIVDITAFKKTQNDLMLAKEEAENSNRLKTEFLNNMSHEIRTPMNGILGFSRMLKEPDIEISKRNNFINIIQNSGHQLLHIIDDILEISRLGTKQVKVIEEEVCLNDLLLELFSIFDIKAKENKTPLYLKKSLSDKESIIISDKTKLNKIFSNLLENALKFTNKGFIEIGYTLKNNNTELEIYIKDTGIGIKPDKQELIFKRFEQAEKELTRKVGGLGLGLSIAKENTELLAGSISVKSEMMEGATFFVNIPFKPVYPTIKIDENSKNYIILVAEDEEINFMYIETILKNVMNLNCDILHAINGKEAVDICKNNSNINLVLMDLKMPYLNGINATKQIRKFNPNIPIIAQTAYSTIEEREEAMNVGCNDFISKPIQKEVLINVIDKILGTNV